MHEARRSSPVARGCDASGDKGYGLETASVVERCGWVHALGKFIAGEEKGASGAMNMLKVE